MAMPLDKAVDLAVRGQFPDDDVRVNGHGFFVRALVPSELLQEGETGYLRHEHIGKDDRIFYSINVLDKAKGTYSAKIVRVQFRGPFNPSGSKKLGTGIEVAGFFKASTDPRVQVVAAALETIMKIIKGLKDAKLQALLDGDFVTAAATIVDRIGMRVATGK